MLYLVISWSSSFLSIHKTVQVILPMPGTSDGDMALSIVRSRGHSGQLPSCHRPVYVVERSSSVVECQTRNQVSPGSNPSLLPFRRLGIFVLSIDAPVDSAVYMSYRQWCKCE